jgi:NADH:ubiquinone oxidoreductase subunit 6 (subunit J)
MDNPIVRLFRFLLVENWPITLVAALGFVAIYLLLPRPRASARVWGVAAAGVALLLAGALIVRAGAFSAEVVLFYAFSAVALVSGGLLVTQSNPARAALSFALVVLSTCGLFLLQAAPFLMAATTIIYAGAIIVTFLFVIMLAQQEGASDADQRSREPLLSSLTGFVLLGALLYVLQASYGTRAIDEATREIDEALARVRQVKEKATLEEMTDIVGTAIVGDDPKKNHENLEKMKAFFGRFRQAVTGGSDSPEAHKLGDEVENIEGEWAEKGSRDRDKARELCERLEQVGLRARLRARTSAGALQPTVPPGAMSDLSGPPANLAPALRRYADDRPEMPHENTGYLGRALFSDYLLAVELGGTLLLVATIGAIAIAGRRGGRST